jgi:metal-responsive CopG/Arc/MetJ family transcriptional regulator
MGRPPIGPNGTKPVNVQMTPELLARVDAEVGGKKHARSKFIREAVEAELKRREK